jgi:hypothetical protein
VAGARLVEAAPGAVPVTLPPSDLLGRVSTTLREEIGPAVTGAYPRTQAFMAAVVLEKVARQLALTAAHERADAADMPQLFADLDTMLTTGDTPSAVRAAVAEGGDTEGLCRVIEALYAHRDALGPSFDAALARVRTTLRASVDRQMEYAR